MMPERIGNIGKAQGVKESSRPAIKKVAIIMKIFDFEISSASLPCSDIGIIGFNLFEFTDVALGKETVKFLI